MIKNERQYRITKAQAEKFAAALEALPSTDAHDHGVAVSVHPLIVKAQRDALESQYADLRGQIAEYEALRSGAHRVLEANSWAELPQVLIRARIAAGLSHKDLADRLGIQEQQVQRYEATGYSSASFERLGEVMRALGVQIREEVFLPSAGVSLEGLQRRLRSVGFDKDFIQEKLLPKAVREGGIHDAGALLAASRIGRVFGWTPAAIFGAAPLVPGRDAIAAARLRVSANAREMHTTAYAVYAHYLCLLALDATRHLQPRPVPSSGREVYDAVVAKYGAMNYEHAVRYVWSLGIPVLPLDDAGAFSGACWRTGGRNAICLKHRTPFTARWLDILLHELGHSGQEPGQPEFAVIEEGDALIDRRDTPEEKAAVRYAWDAALGGRAEELAQKSVAAARGKLQLLKQAVHDVARREGVAVDLLSNYLAYRLSIQGEKWWSTATALQPAGQNPWQVARDVFLENARLGDLAEPDRELLVSALEERQGGSEA